MASGVRIEGLAALRTDLRKLEHLEERREVTRALKEGATVVSVAARPLVRSKSGKMAAGFRAGATGNTAFVRNRVAWAGVQEHGGVIRPKGSPITIRPQKAITRALAASEESIVDKVGDALDNVFRAAGWR